MGKVSPTSARELLVNSIMVLGVGSTLCENVFIIHEIINKLFVSLCFISVGGFLHSRAPKFYEDT